MNCAMFVDENAQEIFSTIYNIETVMQWGNSRVSHALRLLAA